MPEKVIRFSVSLEAKLLAAFDRLCQSRGYTNRSEAIRDLLREQLLREQDRRASGKQVAVVSLVYDHHQRQLSSRLMGQQHEGHKYVVATLHVHLGPHHCLEVIVLRGPAAEIRKLGSSLIAVKGVLHGDIRFTGDEGTLSQLHGGHPPA